MAADGIDLAYDAFTDQVDHNIETSGPSVDLEVAVAAGQLDDVMTAVRAMCRAACGKAKLLWTGSPEGTILRNKITKASATRVISAAGIPLWQISTPDGSRWDTHEPVLEPEADWVCIYNPHDEED